MKIENIFLIACTFYGFTSCYEDKGNYDYMAMNDITVSVNTENDSYALGDKLSVTPELTFAMGQETSELSYTWTFDGQLISNERNLDWNVDILGANKDLRLAVLDNTTGVTYFGEKIITVSSSFATDSWVVLSEKDGKSMLSFLRYQTEDGKLKPVVTRDLYGVGNGGESMGSQPVSMYPHWTNRWDGEDNTSWLWISQEGGQGAVDLSGSDWTREAVLSDLWLGNPPADFVPAGVIDMQVLTLAVSKDGKIYTRIKDSNLLFNSSQFLNRPLTSDEEGLVTVDGSMIAYSRFDEHGGLLLYDKNSHKYFHIGDYINWDGSVYANKVMSLSVNENTYAEHPDWARLDNMDGYTVHYVGAHRDAAWRGLQYAAIIEKDGVPYLQRFVVYDYYGGRQSTIGAELIAQTRADVLKSVINGTNHFAIYRYDDSADFPPYLLISKGNELYYYDGTSCNLAATFPAPITSFDTEYYNNTRIIVGLENGDVFILNGTRSYIDSTVMRGQSFTVGDSGNDEDFVLYHDKDFGRIVQVMYKWKESWNESFF